MTPQDHNRVLGIMHLIYGGFNALMMLMVGFFMLFFGIMSASVPPDNNAPPIAFFMFLGALMLVLGVVLSLPSLFAGYGLLKRKSWAKTAGIVASFLAALSFPYGTALCIYAIWFFFGEGRKFYEPGAFHAPRPAALHEASVNSINFGWKSDTTASRESAGAYVPPSQPPDWREQ